MKGIPLLEGKLDESLPRETIPAFKVPRQIKSLIRQVQETYKYKTYGQVVENVLISFFSGEIVEKGEDSASGLAKDNERFKEVLTAYKNSQSELANERALTKRLTENVSSLKKALTQAANDAANASLTQAANDTLTPLTERITPQIGKFERYPLAVLTKSEIEENENPVRVTNDTANDTANDTTNEDNQVLQKLAYEELEKHANSGDENEIRHHKARIANLEQEIDDLLAAQDPEGDDVSDSLYEEIAMLKKQKEDSDSNIEKYKSGIQQYHRQLNSLKGEKELSDWAANESLCYVHKMLIEKYKLEFNKKEFLAIYPYFKNNPKNETSSN